MWSNRVQLGQIWHNLAQPDAVISDCIQAHIVFTSKKIHSGQKNFLMRNLNFDNICVIFFSTWILWKVLRISFETQIILEKKHPMKMKLKKCQFRGIFFSCLFKINFIASVKSQFGLVKICFDNCMIRFDSKLNYLDMYLHTYLCPSK